MKILVLGDGCQDVYIYGRCDRLCPDAPVPVLLPTSHVETGGMALNVQANIIGLEVSCDIITNEKIITKTRYVDAKTNQMLVRVDSDVTQVDRIQNVDSIPFENYDAIVLSDYCKGFLTENDIETISNRHPLTFLDTKKLLGPWCKNVSFIKINEQEYDRTKHLIDNDIKNHLIITLGSKGCVYQGINFPVQAVEVKDMTGAGDTFLAGLCTAYVKNQDIFGSIEFANRCATIVVQKRGVSVISTEEVVLNQALELNKNQ